ncbi:MAG: signal peptidase I [Chloroflexi bacterium]|nr:signal peptidase I [Chloroflexota bacterium]
MKAFLRDVLATLVLAVVIYLLLQVTVQHSVVISQSMEPTLQVGQHLIVNKVVFKFREPQRGDVIVFRPPNSPNPGATPYIKRVIGIPGDSIEIKGGAVYRNSQKLDEPYIKSAPTYTLPKMTVPANNYFVLGDNRNNSGDSHLGWTVTRQELIGKAWLTIFPFSRWGVVDSYSVAR